MGIVGTVGALGSVTSCSTLCAFRGGSNYPLLAVSRKGDTVAPISGLEALGRGSQEAARPEHPLVLPLRCLAGAAGTINVKAQGP